MYEKEGCSISWRVEGNPSEDSEMNNWRVERRTSEESIRNNINVH